MSIALAVFALAAVAFGAAALKNPSSTAAPTGAGEAEAELAPALVAKLNTLAAPGSKQEGDRGAGDDEWLKHSTPGTTIPNAALEGSREDWEALSSRGGGSGRWTPLGPTWAKSLPNPYRDRGVYNSGTPDFSGRIAHVAIDPNCGNRGRHGDDDDDDDDDNGGGSCRLWIANAAGGGVWRTENALSSRPTWRYLSMSFEHNSTAAVELDPNDHRANTLWVGTGEPNACGSGCEAGVGLYKSTNGGNTWSGPFGQNVFYNRGVGTIAVKPGDSNTIFAGSVRAIRGLSSSCCGGVDSMMPGAPDFGLFRSKDGGATWQLVNQGATVFCSPPETYHLGGAPCSPRGARRVHIDPVDPNTVYASFFARGIWRSNANGDPGTWEQIMAPVGPIGNNERAEFDVVELPNGSTRMYVGVGGGVITNPAPPPAPPTIPAYARFRRNDNVRSAPAGTVAASWIDLTSAVQDTPGYSSHGYCDGQCVYDNYVFVPKAHFPNSGADANTVYLQGDNHYDENNWGPLSPRCNAPTPPPHCPENPTTGRSNGRAVLLSTNAGEYFTDMTEDDRNDFYPGAQHPDHHAMVVNPRDWKQFISVGDGGIIRSNGRFIDDSGDCVQPKGYTGTRLTFCQLVLSRVPERLTTFNRGLRTVHFYQINNSPHDPDVIVGGTQDNGSWEIGDARGSGTNSGPPVLPYPPPDTDEFPSQGECRGDDDDDDDGGGGGNGGGSQVWVNTNVADGGHNSFDIGDRCFRLTSFQGGAMMVHYEPKNQVDANWISDTTNRSCATGGYGCELNAFIGVDIHDPVRPHWLWASREHVFRSMNQGRNPILTRQTHREHCNIWYGDADVDDNGVFEPAKDVCDDWQPLGDPTPAGRLTTGPAYGTDKAGSYVSVVERAHDNSTLWAATGVGRVFVSKNADTAVPAAVVFDRIDNDTQPAAITPPRFVTAIHVDPNDPNHAWITYSGYNLKTPTTPGHVFEVRYAPAGGSTFTRLDDATAPRDKMGDIPATSIAVAKDGTVYVGTDYGCVKRSGGSWSECGSGLPAMDVADLTYVRKRNTIYAATHGQGVWALRVGGRHDDD